MNEPTRVGRLLETGKTGLSGWEFVERQMELQIEAGISNEQAYRRHLENSGLMASWMRFNAWKTDHPGQSAPPEVNRIESEPATEPARKDLD